MVAAAVSVPLRGLCVSGELKCYYYSPDHCHLSPVAFCCCCCGCSTPRPLRQRVAVGAVAGWPGPPPVPARRSSGALPLPSPVPAHPCTLLPICKVPTSSRNIPGTSYLPMEMMCRKPFFRVKQTNTSDSHFYIFEG
jgi:hypothetical protein